MSEVPVEFGAVLSNDGVYRYMLTRSWAAASGEAVFVMLNPSTADANIDDPTIRRCMNFARDWGYGGIVVANLYGLRATDPRELLAAEDPIGPENDEYLRGVIAGSQQWGYPVIAAWGVRGSDERVQAVRAMADEAGVELWCLGTAKAGQPKHPLYLPAKTRPTPWRKS